MSQLRITGTPPGVAVTIDGKLFMCTSFDLHIDPRPLPVARIGFENTFVDFDLTSIEFSGEIALASEHRDAMIALGWLPPEHECI